MSAHPFADDESRMLTAAAFDFVLNNELKRAVRAQTYLTLLVIEGSAAPAAGDRVPATEIARVISREVRETDLLSADEAGRLSLVLLDADLPNSMGVVDRLVARLQHYAFPVPTTISVGAACCPTHGADAATLQRTAQSRPVRRDPHGQTSNAQ